VRFVLLAVLLFVLPAVHAATVSVTQSGADPGTVMKGRYFTITVSGLSGSGTATLILPSGVTVEEGTTKSFSSGTSSVSWTTAIAGQTLTGQKIYVSISTTGSPVTAASDPFDIVLPPSLELSVYPTSFVDPQGDKTLQLTIKNWGETTARDVNVRLSLPQGVSISSGSATQTISAILGGTGGNGESRGVSWVLSFTSPTNSSIEITVSPSNADSKSVTVPVVVYGTTQTQPTTTSGGGGGGGGGGAVAEKPNVKEIPKILSGSHYTVSFDTRLVPGLESVQIFAAADQYLTRLTVETFQKKPEWVNFAEPEGRVYIYYRITYSKPSTYVERAKITFRVNESWLRAEDIDPERLILYRLSSTGEWTPLPTVPERAGDGYITYSAIAQGFSWFAVVGEPGTGFRDIFAEAERVQQVVEEKLPEQQTQVSPQEKVEPQQVLPPSGEQEPSVSVAPETEEKKKRWICAPTAVLLVLLLPLLLRRRI